jgi:RNA polymerase sigma-70 factor (ECF subfamily)
MQAILERSLCPDDADVRLAAAGSREAFDRLVTRYQHDTVNAVSYYLRNYEDAVDAAQEAFLKAYRSLAGFRGGSTFRTWLLRIAINTARSLSTRSRAKKRGGDPGRAEASTQAHEYRGSSERTCADIPDPDSSGGPTRLLERKEVKDAIERAISELDDEAREIVVLRDIAGESYEAVSEALGLPLGTVKSRLHRARLELRRKMSPYL